MCPNCILNQASLSGGIYVAFGVCAIFFVVAIVGIWWAFRNGEFNRFAGDDFVRRARKFDQHRMRPWCQSPENDRLAARVNEVPRRVVYRDVNVADARRYIQRSFAIHGYDPQMLRPVLYKDPPGSQRF